MSESFNIDQVNDHDYRMRTDIDGQTFESLFRLRPDLVEKLGLSDVDEKTVVEATAEFLSQHQTVREFPPLIDLEDILATYDQYPQQLRDLLAAEH
ncbi:hypothetical protein [Arthrobacter sp. B0490]|uniref:hypothetical protein n=1 Tax=Arthrobacter sp. B0490 TaxID=2058891 RepID=UPI000CE2CDA5|nr:hypothetical protein [Arthrobacter sp. B0490]